MTRRARLRFWLLVMDAICRCGGFGSRPFTWAVRRASDCTDWGPIPPPDGRGAPW